VNRYDILLGKKAPPFPPEPNKVMVVGERRSGKTEVLLRMVKRSFEARRFPVLSIAGSQRIEIQDRLGKIYYELTLCTGFDERRIRGRKYLFLDNVDMYLEKLQFLYPEQNVMATCDEDLFLQYYKYDFIPYGKILTINRMKWKLYRIDEIFKGDILPLIE
jgi:hypothetical protein